MFLISIIIKKKYFQSSNKMHPLNPLFFSLKMCHLSSCGHILNLKYFFNFYLFPFQILVLTLILFPFSLHDTLLFPTFTPPPIEIQFIKIGQTLRAISTKAMLLLEAQGAILSLTSFEFGGPKFESLVASGGGESKHQSTPTLVQTVPPPQKLLMV